MRSTRVRAPVALPVMARVWPSMMLACSTTALRSCTNSVCADPFDLQRFVDKQVPAAFSAALAEIKAGRKQTHWSWWLFPTAPFVVDGKERGSATNRAFALRDRPPHGLTGEDAAAAFLARPPQRGERDLHLEALRACVLGRPRKCSVRLTSCAECYERQHSKHHPERTPKTVP